MLRVKISNRESRQSGQLFWSLYSWWLYQKFIWTLWVLEVLFAEGAWLVNTRGTPNCPSPAQKELVHSLGEGKAPVVWDWKRQCGLFLTCEKASICGIVFTQGPGCTWWIMQKDEEIQSAGDSSLRSGAFSFLGRNNQWSDLHVIGSNIAETTLSDEGWASQWTAWVQWWPKSIWCWHSAIKHIASFVLSNHHDAGVPDHSLFFWTFCGVTESYRVDKLALSVKTWGN